MRAPSAADATACMHSLSQRSVGADALRSATVGTGIVCSLPGVVALVRFSFRRCVVRPSACNGGGGQLVSSAPKVEVGAGVAGCRRSVATNGNHSSPCRSCIRNHASVLCGIFPEVKAACRTRNCSMWTSGSESTNFSEYGERKDGITLTASRTARTSCHIAVPVKRNGLEDRKDWPNQYEWLTFHLDALHDAFADRVRKLQKKRRGFLAPS